MAGTSDRNAPGIQTLPLPSVIPFGRRPTGTFNMPGSGARRFSPIAPADITGQVNPDGMNRLARQPEKNQVMVASRDAMVPILYGGPEQLAGLLYIAKVYGTALYLAAIYGEGEFQSIGTNAGDDMVGILVNGQPAPAGITVQKHLGTAGQAADSLLTSVLAGTGFAETLANTAYAVYAVGAGAVAGWPQITPSCLGRKLYDPRSNLLPYSNTLSSWTEVGTCAAAQNADGAYGATNYAWTLTDDSAAAHEGRTIAFTIASSANAYRWAVKVKKTSGGTSKTARVDVSLAGGTVVTSSVLVNTDDGNFTGGSSVTVTDLGATWLVEGTITDNASGNNALGVALYPAVAPNGSFTQAVATTGSAVFSEVQVRLASKPAGYVATPGATAVDQPTVWSDNPALILGDYLASATYGEGRTVDAASLAAAAEYCDHMMGAAGKPNEKRARATIQIDTRQPTKAWRDILRAYVPCWVNIVGDTAYLTVDRAGPVVHTFTAANICDDPPPVLQRAGIRDTPTIVSIGYTDTSVVPWRLTTAEADTGDPDPRRTRIDMPGIRSYSQARRFAIERLNHYTLEDLTGEITVFEDGLKVLPGDIAAITDEIGLSAKQVRILGVQDLGHGRWRLRFREYDPAVYSGVVETTPTSPDVTPPNPNAPPAVSGLVLTEDRRQESGVWVSRIRATWNPEATWPFVAGYIVQLFDVATAATYTWSAGVVEVSSAAHGLAINDVAYFDFTSGGLTTDEAYGVTAVPNANAFRTLLPGSGAGGNVTWRKLREHVVLPKVESWLSQPVVLGVGYLVRVRVMSTSGVVGP